MSSRLSRWLKIPPASSSDPRWHVSAPVDLCAYAFGWVWVLLPLAWLGDARADYLGWYLLVLLATDVHRHYGLPYVYLDREIRSRFAVRFTLFPVVMLVAWGASPFIARWKDPWTPMLVAELGAWVILLVQVLRRDRDGRPFPWADVGFAALGGCVVAGLCGLVGPERWAGLFGLATASLVLDARAYARGRGVERTPRFLGPATLLLVMIGLERAGENIWTASIRPRDVLNLAAVFAGVWNIWHVYMQKYGILRMYNAKNGQSTKVPGWVDRLLVFGWLPFNFVWLGSTQRELIHRSFSSGRQALGPVVTAMEAAAPYALVPTSILVVVAVGLFFYYEWKVHRWSNRPRVWMAIGTTLLSSAFIWLHPMKAYLAYAFSHAVEYMVFVWAFQRRRYALPRTPSPPLQRALRHPALAYGLFTIGLGTLFGVLKYWGYLVAVGSPRPYFVGFSTTEWIKYWTVFQSMVHFYFDGFLWKMRHESTRRHL